MTPDAAPGDAPREAPGGSRGEAADRLARLLAKARALPARPGVYLMKDAGGAVVYIGKALRLADRVSSYFVPSADLGYKKQPLLAVVDDFEVIECDSEWEALLTEARLIKDTRPRFNARLTDDKTFPYLAVTVREAYPRVVVTRSPTDPDLKGARVLGPFTNAGSLRHAVALLQRVFRFRTCNLDIVEGDPKNRYFRPCILHAIDQCTAPCADRVTREAYRADIDRLLRFLHSGRTAMLRELRRDMERASAELRFEEAAGLRDQIRAIERLDERARRERGRAGAGSGWQPETEVRPADPRRAARALRKILGTTGPVRVIEGIDIAHLQGEGTVGSKVCFIDARPFKHAYRRYRVRSAENDDYAAIREVVSRRYREAGAGQELYPDVILVDGGLGQLHAALEAFEQLEQRPPMVVSLAKKEELVYIQRRSEPVRLGRENAGLRLLQAVRDEAHRFAQHYHHVLRRKKTLDEEP